MCRSSGLSPCPSVSVKSQDAREFLLAVDQIAVARGLGIPPADML